jgi:hypothetical protein
MLCINCQINYPPKLAEKKFSGRRIFSCRLIFGWRPFFRRTYGGSIIFGGGQKNSAAEGSSCFVAMCDVSVIG